MNVEKVEVMLNGELCELVVGELSEVWENVTVEVLELPNGEMSVAWKRQPNTVCTYKKGEG